MTMFIRLSIDASSGFGFKCGAYRPRLPAFPDRKSGLPHNRPRCCQLATICPASGAVAERTARRFSRAIAMS